MFRDFLVLVGVLAGSAYAAAAGASVDATFQANLADCVNPLTNLPDTLVSCFVDPCVVAPACRGAVCRANYCGGCHALYYDELTGQRVECDKDCSATICPAVVCQNGLRPYVPDGECCPRCPSIDCSLVRCAAPDCPREYWYTPPGSCCPRCRRPYGYVGDYCDYQHPCRPGLECADDPNDSCDPNSLSDIVDSALLRYGCPGVCREPDVFCTADALICPDGTIVGRTLPDCEFECPGEMCGGIAGIQCPDGYTCVDDPTDDCDWADPWHADCSGLCVPDEDDCAFVVCPYPRRMPGDEPMPCAPDLYAMVESDHGVQTLTSGFVVNDRCCGHCEPCPDVCLAIWEPVCGSDGQTYSNECMLRVARCEKGDPDLVVVHQGECRDRCADFDPYPGCRDDGCPDGEFCNTNPFLVPCVPSECWCDPFTGLVSCTRDCSGGVCQPVGDMCDPDEDPSQKCRTSPDDCIPSACSCDSAYGDWICTDDCGGGRYCDCTTPNPADQCRGAETCIPSYCFCENGQWICTEDCGGGRNCGCEGANPADECNDPDDPNQCVPSYCSCQEETGQWLCTRDCGPGRDCDPCKDLADVDFGPCDLFLGYGVVNGWCAPISGCSDQGYNLQPTRWECRQACPDVNVVCVDEVTGESHKVGTRWRQDACTVCYCATGGEIVCNSIECDIPVLQEECGNGELVYTATRCCPICVEPNDPCVDSATGATLCADKPSYAIDAMENDDGRLWCRDGWELVTDMPNKCCSYCVPVHCCNARERPAGGREWGCCPTNGEWLPVEYTSAGEPRLFNCPRHMEPPFGEVCPDPCGNVICPQIRCAPGFKPEILPGDCCPTCVPSCEDVYCPPMDVGAVRPYEDTASGQLVCPDDVPRRLITLENGCCARCVPEKCCDPELEPGVGNNPLCFEGHSCCPLTGTWTCNNAMAQPVCPGVSAADLTIRPGRPCDSHPCEDDPCDCVVCPEIYCPVGYTRIRPEGSCCDECVPRCSLVDCLTTNVGLVSGVREGEVMCPEPNMMVVEDVDPDRCCDWCTQCDGVSCLACSSSQVAIPVPGSCCDRCVDRQCCDPDKASNLLRYCCETTGEWVAAVGDCPYGEGSGEPCSSNDPCAERECREILCAQGYIPVPDPDNCDCPVCRPVSPCDLLEFEMPHGAVPARRRLSDAEPSCPNGYKLVETRCFTYCVPVDYPCAGVKCPALPDGAVPALERLWLDSPNHYLTTSLRKYYCRPHYELVLDARGCCPHCKPRGCVDENGEVHAPGDHWNPEPCMFCWCTDEGETRCAIADCAYPTCANGATPYVPEGQCCPICPPDTCDYLDFFARDGTTASANLAGLVDASAAVRLCPQREDSQMPVADYLMNTDLTVNPCPAGLIARSDAAGCCLSCDDPCDAVRCPEILCAPGWVPVVPPGQCCAECRRKHDPCDLLDCWPKITDRDACQEGTHFVPNYDEFGRPQCCGTCQDDVCPDPWRPHSKLTTADCPERMEGSQCELHCEDGYWPTGDLYCRRDASGELTWVGGRCEAETCANVECPDGTWNGPMECAEDEKLVTTANGCCAACRPVCSGDEGDCGPPLGMPNWQCADGSVGGPTGNCLPTRTGECVWEINWCCDPEICAANTQQCYSKSYCGTGDQCLMGEPTPGAECMVDANTRGVCGTDGECRPECDYSSTICSGHGRCSLGQCYCYPGFTGEDCSMCEDGRDADNNCGQPCEDLCPNFTGLVEEEDRVWALFTDLVNRVESLTGTDTGLTAPPPLI